METSFIIAFGSILICMALVVIDDIQIKVHKPSNEYTLQFCIRWIRRWKKIADKSEQNSQSFKRSVAHIKHLEIQAKEISKSILKAKYNL